jgi:GNAT superfamily N-acetyltransferase
MADPKPHNLSPTHAETAAALIRAAFAELAGRVDPPPSALKETAATVAETLTRGGGAGINGNGALVACVLWEEKAGGLYFGRLAVAPEARGRGLARLLIAAVEAEARRRSLPRTHLGVRLTLPANRRLFASCGYAETTQRTHAGYVHPTSVDMEKRLA